MYLYAFLGMWFGYTKPDDFPHPWELSIFTFNQNFIIFTIKSINKMFIYFGNFLTHFIKNYNFIDR